MQKESCQHIISTTFYYLPEYDIYNCYNAYQWAGDLFFTQRVITPRGRCRPAWGLPGGFEVGLSTHERASSKDAVDEWGKHVKEDVILYIMILNVEQRNQETNIFIDASKWGKTTMVFWCFLPPNNQPSHQSFEGCFIPLVHGIPNIKPKLGMVSGFGFLVVLSQSIFIIIYPYPYGAFRPWGYP